MAATTSAAPVVETPKSSLNFKLDELEGQKVREWFKEDFKADKKVEFAPKFKSSKGHIKAKLVVAPATKDKDGADRPAVVNEEIEIQSQADGRDIQFKLKGTELSGYFDLGHQAVGGHFLNPYVNVVVPRIGATFRSSGSTNWGFLFHTAASRWGSGRLHADFNFDQAASAESAAGVDVAIKTNFAWNYRFLTFALWEQWKLNKQLDATAKASVAAKHGQFQGFAEAGFSNFTTYTGSYFGLSAAVIKGLTAYGFASHEIEDANKVWRYGAGADWQHCKGFSAKANWTSNKTKGKVSAVVTFSPTPAASASFVFEHGCDKSTTELGWGIKTKFNL